MKHLITIALLFTSITAFGQNFIQKPNLEMRTVVSGKQKIYRLKANNKLWIRTKSDSVLIKDKITGFTKDSALKLKYSGRVDLNEIEVICFKPLKTSRTVKQVIYAAGLSLNLYICYASIMAAPGTDTSPTIVLLMLNSISTVIIAETMGALSYAEEEKITLQNENTHFSILYPNTPSPYKDSIP